MSPTTKPQQPSNHSLVAAYVRLKEKLRAGGFTLLRATLDRDPPPTIDPQLHGIIAAAVDAALAEVRRQGGPEYMLAEARSEGIDAGIFRARALDRTITPAEERLALLEDRQITLARRVALLMNAHLMLRRLVTGMCDAPGCQRMWVESLWMSDERRALSRCEKHPLTPAEIEKAEKSENRPSKANNRDLHVAYSDLLEKLIEEVGYPCP
jgi:hypothetical protein